MSVSNRVNFHTNSHTSTHTGYHMDSHGARVWTFVWIPVWRCMWKCMWCTLYLYFVLWYHYQSQYKYQLHRYKYLVFKVPNRYRYKYRYRTCGFEVEFACMRSSARTQWLVRVVANTLRLSSTEQKQSWPLATHQCSPAAIASSSPMVAGSVTSLRFTSRSPEHRRCATTEALFVTFVDCSLQGVRLRR